MNAAAAVAADGGCFSETFPAANFSLLGLPFIFASWVSDLEDGGGCGLDLGLGAAGGLEAGVAAATAGFWARDTAGELLAVLRRCNSSALKSGRMKR